MMSTRCLYRVCAAYTLRSFESLLLLLLLLYTAVSRLGFARAPVFLRAHAGHHGGLQQPHTWAYSAVD